MATGARRRTRSIVLIGALLLGAGPSAALAAATPTDGVSASSTRFDDVARSDPHRPAIDGLAAQGVIRGCTASRFCPARAVTRGQVASLLARAFDLPAASSMPFTDVPAGSVHARNIAAVAAAGITRGVTATRFAPGAPVRRDQMASLLAAALELDRTSTARPFRDVARDSVHASSIAELAAAGVAAGRRDGTYHPSGTVTRAQAASFLDRALAFASPIDLGAWPDAGSTGVPTGTSLRSSGSITTSRDGQVIEELAVTGTISVLHDDVTIRRVRVRATSHYGISVPAGRDDDVTGLTIEDVDLVGVSGERSAGIAPYGRWHARRVDISGFADGVKVTSGQILEDSYIHDLYRSSGSHNDAVQSAGGRGVVLRGNRLEGLWRTQTSAIIISTNTGPVADYTIVNNLVSGGIYTVYLRNKGSGHGPPRDLVVRDNVWVEGSWASGPLSQDRGSGWAWANNRTSSGRPIGSAG